MRKLFFAAAVMAGILITTAASATDLNADDRGIVNFSGSFDVSSFESEYDSYFSYRVTNKSGDICAYGQTKENSGNVDFSFKLKGDTGEYTLVLSNRKLGKKTYTVSYVSNLFIDFNEIKATADANEMDIFLNDSGLTFGFDIFAYQMLGETEKNNVINYFMSLKDMASMTDLINAAQNAAVTNRLFKTASDASYIVKYIDQSCKTEGMLFNTAIARVYSEDLTESGKLSVAKTLMGGAVDTNKMKAFELEVLKARVSAIVYYMDMEEVIYSDGNIWGFYDRDLTALYGADKAEVYKGMKNAVSSASSIDSYRQQLSKLIADNPSKDPSYPDTRDVNKGSAIVGTGDVIFSVEFDKTNSPFPKDIKIDTVSVYQTAENIKFADLEGYDWAREAINKLVENYIVNGISNEEFRPGANVTREEFAKMIAAGLRLTGAEAVTTFSDVKDDDWFYSYVAATERAKIVYGDDNNNFGVGQNITRQDAAVMISRAMTAAEAEIELGEAVTFTDADLISSYAKGAVSKLARAGIINGMPDGSFQPLSNLTRAEAAQMMYGFFSKAQLLTW